ncbi:hypothetical protein [Carboxylicivirga sp. RSCT41]|uniref:hypothetical protein n=1 Tax=Carboxylicivirga agarovorans TaxID=3417570 RepID=UPI003D3411EB
MTRYILSLLMIFSLWACSEDKEVLELNAAPSLLDYQNYLPSVLKGQAWVSGEPIVRGEGKMTYKLKGVTYLNEVLEEHGFTMDDNGIISLAEGNILETGSYSLSVEASNTYGSIINEQAIKLEVVEEMLPVIMVHTPSGTNEVELLINPAGLPVDADGTLLDGLLPDVSLSFTNLNIGEILMSPGDVFTFGRQSDYVTDGDSNTGVIEMVGPFEQGTYTLVFNGTVSKPEPVTLHVHVSKLNLPYDESIFELDLSQEQTGPHNDVPELLIAGLQTSLVYGELKSGKAFWNVQADKNHPDDTFDTTPILRWLPFNAATGYDNATANKSQSIAVVNDAIDVSKALELRIDASFLANKAAELTSGLLRCDVRVCSEEDYQAMLALSSQSEKQAAVSNWNVVASSFGTSPSAGTDDNTGYGYFELSAVIDKAELPESTSNQIRVLYHMVADKDGPNPGYLAIQSLTIEGTFRDNQ